MNNLSQLLADLEHQDLYQILKYGMPEDIQEKVRILCDQYKAAALAEKAALKTTLTRQATWIILSFATYMAESALRGDKEAIDIGLVAFDFSNIMRIDFRDGFGPAGLLAFAAKQCGIDIVERVKEVIPDASPQLVLMFKSPISREL